MDIEIQTDAARLVRRLRQAGLRITVAESCTGGLLASTLTDTLVSATAQRRQRSWTPRELTKEQEAGLQSAFLMFDEARLGRLDESQLREVLRSADACVGGDEAALASLSQRVMCSAAGGVDARRELLEHRR